jgi:hypothetical protein
MFSDEVVGVEMWIFIGLVLLYVLLGQEGGEMATGGEEIFRRNTERGQSRGGQSPRKEKKERKKEREEIQTTPQVVWLPNTDWAFFYLSPF